MPFEIAEQVALDPYIADNFTVTRRQEVVDTRGRSSTQDTPYAGIAGVVTMAEDEQLLREQFPEFAYATRMLSIVTTFRMQIAVAGYKADTVTWHGDTYLVIRCDPYPQFGSGFYQAVVSSMDKLDASI